MSINKKRSFLEATLNSLSSLITAWACWALIIIPWVLTLGWDIMKLNFWQVLAVNTAFTVVGTLRNYGWRLLFERKKETV